jgi:glycosyltransferase involved in cell wall biosynthesis
MSFSYIIPFKFTVDRFRTLTRVLDNIKNLECEIIIIEQGIESLLPKQKVDLEYKYIFLHNPLPFNKSWALNVAWKEAKFDNIVFGDADNLIDCNYIVKALEELSEWEMISPHMRLVDLDVLESQMDNDQIFKIDRPGRGETDHQKMTLCGAMTIFKKSSLEKIGGWPEEFIGWGAEDDAMSIKVQHFLKWKALENNCYHLHHDRVNPDMQFYYRNLHIYNNYINAPKENIWTYIEKVRPFIGDKNRKALT